jgi:hypothetical protein
VEQRPALPFVQVYVTSRRDIVVSCVPFVERRLHLKINYSEPAWFFYRFGVLSLPLSMNSTEFVGAEGELRVDTCEG